MTDITNPSCVLVIHNFYKTTGYLGEDRNATTFISYLPYVYSFLLSTKEALRNDNFLAIKPFISQYFIEKTNQEEKKHNMKVRIHDRIPSTQEKTQGRPITLGFGDFIRTEPSDNLEFIDFFLKETDRQQNERYPTLRYNSHHFDKDMGLRGIYDVYFAENKTLFYIPFLSLIVRQDDQTLYPEGEFVDLQDLLAGIKSGDYSADAVSKFVLKRYEKIIHNNLSMQEVVEYYDQVGFEKQTDPV